MSEIRLCGQQRDRDLGRYQGVCGIRQVSGDILDPITIFPEFPEIPSSLQETTGRLMRLGVLPDISHHEYFQKN